MAAFEHLSEKGWMWRKNGPSYNLAMLDARLAHACLAVSFLFCACGPKHQTNPGGDAGSAGQAGSAGLGGGGADAGGAGAGAGGASAGSGGAAGGGGSAGSGGVPNCGPLGGGAGLGGAGGGAGLGAGGSAGSAADAAPAPTPVGTDLGTLTVESVASWKNASKGAYTIIHDDICDYNIDSLFTIAEPELTKRGLRAAFGAIVERCQIRNLWSQLETVRSHGHEIINHSWDHKDIAVDPQATLDQQLDLASTTLDQNLVNQHTSFFIFPYDSFNDAAVARLRSLNYLGARAGVRGLNGSAFADGMRVSFDVYERPTSTEKYSIYWDQPDIMKYYVDLAVSLDGWAVREFHGVADDTFEPVGFANYQAHLDDVKAKQDAGDLWVDTPSNVLRYHFSRMYCGTPTASGFSVVPATPSCECGYYSAPLSVIVKTTTDAPSAVAVQDGVMMPTRKLEANRFVVDMNPLGGPVAIGGGS